MAAQIKIYGATGAGPTLADAEGGIVFNREDTLTGTTPTPKPTATGTNFSWPKTLALYCEDDGGSTSISNRQVKINASPPTGLKVHFKASASYTQASAPADDPNGSNGAVPDGFTEMTTSFQTYDADAVAATDDEANGDYLIVALGVDNTYDGGAGSDISVATITLSYDES